MSWYNTNIPFLKYLENRKSYGKHVINMKRLLHFPYKLRFKLFSFRQIIMELDAGRNGGRGTRKVSVIFVRFWQKL
jgi:hypothetical protein